MVNDFPPETCQASPQASAEGGSDLDTTPSRRWGRWVAIGIVIVAVSPAVLLSWTGSPQRVDLGKIHTVKSGELLVSVTEQGTLESSASTEIKCRVGGKSKVTWVIESGTTVEPGDELLRLDTLSIDERINDLTKEFYLAQSATERSKADVETAKLAIQEYKKGTFVAELKALEKDLAIAESRLRTADSLLRHKQRMFESQYVSKLEIDEREFAVTQAQLRMDSVNTQIEVLTKYTKVMELERLRGELNAAEAKYEADKERKRTKQIRLELAKDERKNCVVKAQRRGIVLHPTGEAWERTPEMEEGTTVHKDQTVLLMPDLTKMQVKVGIHESIIDRVTPGLTATITLPEITLEGEVSYVSSVTRPAGWWTGNVVKYDVLVELPPTEALRPGMSAEVEVMVAHHEKVLTVPVTAVVETARKQLCWIKSGKNKVERRVVQLGDSNDMFVEVKAGVREGEKVVVDPMAFVEEARLTAGKTLRGPRSTPSDASAKSDRSKSSVQSNSREVD